MSGSWNSSPVAWRNRDGLASRPDFQPYGRPAFAADETARTRAQILEDTIRLVLISHYDTHRRAIERKLRYPTVPKVARPDGR